MRRLNLMPDCGSCAALCCVATSFEASEDFACDKPAGARCPNLASDNRCSIHGELTERGFSGCVVFDCYGAGQHVTSAFASGPSADRERNHAFSMVRDLHELLFLLTEAAKICPPAEGALRALISAQIEHLDAISSSVTADIVNLDFAALHAQAHDMLRSVGNALGGPSTDRRESPKLANGASSPPPRAT